MSNNYFKFKQFTIEQDGCAMKVGTDGCLLGAWFDTKERKKILDAGTGSGLIAIMAAQRSKAEVTGIEIDPTAAAKAKENVKNSPWSERIKIINGDFLTHKPTTLYDCIVSNPPYFNNSLKCDNEQRTLARHNDSLTPEAFFTHAKEILNTNGSISLIIPDDIFELWEKEAIFKGFSTHKITFVRTTPRKKAKRILVEFGREVCTSPKTEELILENHPGEYSEKAKSLLRDFYLKIV